MRSFEDYSMAFASPSTPSKDVEAGPPPAWPSSAPSKAVDPPPAWSCRAQAEPQATAGVHVEAPPPSASNGVHIEEPPQAAADHPCSTSCSTTPQFTSSLSGFSLGVQASTGEPSQVSAANPQTSTLISALPSGVRDVAAKAADLGRDVFQDPRKISKWATELLRPEEQVWLRHQHEEAELQRTVWSIPLVMGLKPIGMAGSTLMFLLVVLNVGIQVNLSDSAHARSPPTLPTCAIRLRAR